MRSVYCRLMCSVQEQMQNCIFFGRCLAKFVRADTVHMLKNTFTGISGVYCRLFCIGSIYFELHFEKWKLNLKLYSVRIEKSSDWFIKRKCYCCERKILLTCRLQQKTLQIQYVRYVQCTLTWNTTLIAPIHRLSVRRKQPSTTTRTEQNWAKKTL